MSALDEEMIYRVAGTNHESTNSQITQLTDVSKIRVTDGSNDQFQLLATRSQSEHF